MEKTDDDRIGRKICLRSDFAELTHAFSLTKREDAVRIRKSRSLPEHERTVLLECGHAAEDAMVLEMRESPFDCFADFRACPVDEFAKMLKNGACEHGSSVNVRVDSCISILQGGHLSRRIVVLPEWASVLVFFFPSP